MIPREEGDYDTVKTSQIRGQQPVQTPAQQQPKAPGQDIQIQDAARTQSGEIAYKGYDPATGNFVQGGSNSLSAEDRAEAVAWIETHPEEQPEANIDLLREHARAEMPEAPPLFIEDTRGVMMPADQLARASQAPAPTLPERAAADTFIRPGDEPIITLDAQTGLGGFKAAIVGPGTRTARADRDIENDPNAIPAFDISGNRIKGGYYDLVDKRYELYNYEEHGSPLTLGEMGIEKMGKTGMESVYQKAVRDYYGIPDNTPVRSGGGKITMEEKLAAEQYHAMNPTPQTDVQPQQTMMAGMPGLPSGVGKMNLNGREYNDIGAMKLLNISEGITSGYEKIAGFVNSNYNPKDRGQMINRDFLLGAGRIGASALAGLPMAAGAILGLTEQSVQDYATGNTVKVGGVSVMSRGLLQGYSLGLLGGTKKEAREYQAMGPQYLNIVDDSGKVLKTERLADVPITIKETTETQLPSLPLSLAMGAAPSLFSKNPNLAQGAGELAGTALLFGLGARSFGAGVKVNPMLEGVGSRSILSRASMSTRAEAYVRGLSKGQQAPARAAVDIMKIADQTPQRIARAPDLANIEHVPPELAPAIEKTFLDMSTVKPRVYGGATKSQAVNVEFRPTSDVDIMTTSAGKLGEKAVENLNTQYPGIAQLEGSKVSLAKDFTSSSGKTYKAGTKLLDIHDPASNVLGNSDILPPPLRSQIFKGGRDYQSPVSSESLQSYGTMRKSNAMLSNLKEIDMTGGSHRFIKDFGDLVVYGKETKMGLEQLGNNKKAQQLQASIDTLLDSKYTYHPFPEGGKMSPFKVTRTGRDIFSEYTKGYGQTGIDVNIIRTPETISPSLGTRIGLSGISLSPGLSISSRSTLSPSSISRMSNISTSPGLSISSLSSIGSLSSPGITLRSLSLPSIKSITSPSSRISGPSISSVMPLPSISTSRMALSVSSGISPISPSSKGYANVFKPPAYLKLDLGDGGFWPTPRRRGGQKTRLWRNRSVFDFTGLVI